MTEINSKQDVINAYNKQTGKELLDYHVYFNEDNPNCSLKDQLKVLEDIGRLIEEKVCR